MLELTASALAENVRSTRHDLLCLGIVRCLIRPLGMFQQTRPFRDSWNSTIHRHGRSLKAGR
jgi:hypothetical protein